jgi:L-ribulose-5-phosphate 3-epimerase
LKPYSIGLYEKAMPNSLTWREKLKCAKECEYDFVEISIDETDEKLARLDWRETEIQRLIEDMNELEISIRSMCLSGHRKYPFGSCHPATRSRSIEIMGKAIDLADKLGIRLIQLAGYDVYYEESTPESKALFIENLRQAAMMAARNGVLLGFETMETEFMNTVSKSMFYVSCIGSPYLGIYPDVGNLTNAAVSYGTSVIDDLETGKGHIMAVHLKETVPGKFREIPFLTGHVDFEGIIEKAWNLGVRRYVTEMWDVGAESWKQDIQFANRSMRRILDRRAETPSSCQEEG